MPLIGFGVVMALALLPAQQIVLAWLTTRRPSPASSSTPEEGTHS